MFYKDHICCTEEKGPGGSKTRDNEEGSGETEAGMDREKTVSWATAVAENVEKKGWTQKDLEAELMGLGTD